jgi:hypothetical protein
MEAYILVETFEVSWRQSPKWCLLEGEDGATFGKFLQVEDLQAYASLSVGPRGGVSEGVIVVDPGPRVTSDRLLVHSTDGGDVGAGLLLPLANLRHIVAEVSPSVRRDCALGICREAVRSYVPAEDLTAARLRLYPSTPQSIEGIVLAGAPGLGKRGGARGK